MRIGDKHRSMLFADASRWTDDSYYAEFRTMPSSGQVLRGRSSFHSA